MSAIGRLLNWQMRRLRSFVLQPRRVIQTRAVAVEDTDYCDRPIFILGVHRSGTSLVRRMFNSHPKIACPPESFFMAHYADMLEDGRVELGYMGLGYDFEQMRQDLARNAARLHEAYRIAQGKEVWADKTPRYLDKIDAIDRLFGARPVYVLVLRHPCDILFSLHKRGWRFNDIEDPFLSSVAYVKDAIEKLLAFEQRHPERCARLVYQRLVRAPEAELRGCLERVGFDYDPEMLNFGSKSHNFGIEDSIVRGLSSIRPMERAWESWDDRQKEIASQAFGPRIFEEDYWAEPDRAAHARLESRT
ncbi:MAG TPA: sulfotransferase [Allosphingosinicella sp.]|jgi:hypothetical protein|nr:sulfotransferase [Allosphingosinicella sp.]